MERLHGQTFRELARVDRKPSIEQWLQYYRQAGMDALLDELIAEMQQRKNKVTITLRGIFLVGAIALAPFQIRSGRSRCGFVHEQADAFTQRLDHWDRPLLNHVTVVARSISDFDWRSRGFAQDWRKARH